jgi:hypothetical protein
VLDSGGKLFTSTQPDCSRAPIPGEPIRRRSAIAVVMDAVSWALFFSRRLAERTTAETPTSGGEGELDLPSGWILVKS